MTTTVDTETVKNPLISEWPSFLPEKCERCENSYDSRFSLKFGPSRLGRLLRKISPWMILVMMILMAVTKLEFFSLEGGGGMMAFVAALLVPSVALHIAGGIFPIRARLHCHKCGKVAFFHLPNRWDHS